MTKGALAPAVLLAAAVGCGGPSEIDFSGPTAEWTAFAGTQAGLHYSPLTQIRPANVSALGLAWEHRSGDAFPGSADRAPTALQVTPIVANDTLYYCTPYMRVFALDPETGEERWVFDPELRAKATGGPYPLTCRGVSYWSEPRPEPGTACQKRIVYGTKDSELIALDADTGRPCADFGENGRVALREGLEAGIPAWEYYPTSPPAIVGDLAIVGALVADQLRVDAPSGVVRAFDVRNGTLRWAWDPVPPGTTGPGTTGPGPGERGEGERYARGTPNVWSIISADPERDRIYVPTGNASPDSFGGARGDLDHYASSVVALEASTGRVDWHFQTVHHDVWDFDVAPQPALFRLPGVGDGAPALAQGTKMGFVFLLDRVTGKPLYPVEERPVPQGAVPDEILSATQPFPTHPPPLDDYDLEPWGFTPFDRDACAEKMARYRWDGAFTPPSLEGSIQYPHSAGGMNWGSIAIDPTRGLLLALQSHVAMATQLIERETFDRADVGAVVYPDEAYPMRGTPYGVRRKTLFSPVGAPCNAPPWGSLTAVDLASGEIRWKVPLGTTRDQAPFPLWLRLGTPTFGGGLATAGGLYFTGATMDRYFRALDSETGEELWRTRIPYAGNAAPMTYRLRDDSKQYVVIAAGGNPLTGVGDALLAFALEP